MKRFAKPCLTLVAGACLLPACATSGDFRGERDTQNLGDAAMTPVSGLNLSKVDIPTYLSNMRDPYANRPTDCAALSAEVKALNDLMGEDLDVPEDEAERREASALNAASDTVGSVLIPFRGVVRAVSGASSHDRKAREAYQRGLVRRGYLKGIAAAEDCTVPTVAG